MCIAAHGPVVAAGLGLDAVTQLGHINLINAGSLHNGDYCLLTLARRPAAAGPSGSPEPAAAPGPVTVAPACSHAFEAKGGPGPLDRPASGPEPVPLASRWRLCECQLFNLHDHP